MSFRDNLREAIDYSGLEQKELACEAGISLSNIENYLREDASMPSADYAVRIAQALGVTVEYLVTGKNPSDKTSVPITPEVKKLIQTIKDLPADKQRIVIKNAMHLAGII